MGTVMKKTAGYEVRQTTDVFLMFICKTCSDTVKDEYVSVCMWYAHLAKSYV